MLERMPEQVDAQDRHGAQLAIDHGYFRAQTVPVPVKVKRDTIPFELDETVRGDSSVEKLSKMKPAFDKEGTVTAGNASGINDGAAALVVMSEAKAKALGLKVLARIKSYATTALDPKIMGMGPVSASKKALERAGWKPADLDLMEINEAFAAQACAVNKDMGWDPAKVNVNGGAIAIGHPIGASGARVLNTLLHELRRRNAKRGLATLCIGGGMGVAMCVERD
jgi:acetyl-CoA C-acetyltransferase